MILALTSMEFWTDLGTGFGGLVALVFLFFMLRFGWRMGSAAGEAIVHRVPTPPEIATQLRHELGREPTINEVASIHQMLVSDHNKNLMGAAAILGAAVLIGHDR